MNRCASSMVPAIALAAVVCCHGTSTAAENQLNLMPTPKSVKVTGGEMPLTPATLIIATDPKLMKLVKMFSGELLTMTQIRMEPVEAGADNVRAGS